VGLAVAAAVVEGEEEGGGGVGEEEEAGLLLLLLLLLFAVEGAEEEEEVMVVGLAMAATVDDAGDGAEALLVVLAGAAAFADDGGGAVIVLLLLLLGGLGAFCTDAATTGVGGLVVGAVACCCCACCCCCCWTDCGSPFSEASDPPVFGGGRGGECGHPNNGESSQLHHATTDTATTTAYLCSCSGPWNRFAPWLVCRVELVEEAAGGEEEEVWLACLACDDLDCASKRKSAACLSHTCLVVLRGSTLRCVSCVVWCVVASKSCHHHHQ